MVARQPAQLVHGEGRHERCRINAKALGEVDEVHEADVARTGFDPGKVGAVQVGALSQLFLRESCLAAQLAHVLPKPLLDAHDLQGIVGRGSLCVTSTMSNIACGGLMRRLVLLTLFALPLAAEAPLTNEDITALVKAGLTASVIEEKISASPVAFDVSTAGLVALSKAGVPQSVIKAMIAAEKHQPATPVGTREPAPVAIPAPAIVPPAPRTFEMKAIGSIDACLGTLEIGTTAVVIKCTWRHTRQYSAETIKSSDIAKHCYYRSKVALGKNWLFATKDTKPRFYEFDGPDMDEAFRLFREQNPDVPSSANCSMRDLRTEF